MDALRIAAVSDIHGNLPALEAVVADLSRRGVDAVVNLGDCLSGPLLPGETADYLMATPWIHLAGNHDRELLGHCPEAMGASDAYAFSQLSEAHLQWLGSLAGTHELADGIYLCHGSPRNDHEYLLESVDPAGARPAHAHEIRDRLAGIRAPVILCGHTHIPRAVRTPGGQLIVNPGSVGLQAFADSRPYLHVMQTGAPDARYALIERRDGHWSVCLVSVPYDHRSMAALARERRRPEWETALIYGYLGPADALPDSASG